MKVRYQAFRTRGMDMTGKVVEMTETEAAPLIRSNIVVPIEIETATAEPPENAMRPPPRRKHVAKTQHRSNR